MARARGTDGDGTATRAQDREAHRGMPHEVGHEPRVRLLDLRE
ncbi:hypothetical protein [Demequina litorisediminis]|nr:hypothetical protein [Demequina litorisediminis]